jgi:parvulin-like peptidyl-prolyl isomerase
MSIIKIRAKMGSTMKIVLLGIGAILVAGIFFSFGGPPSSSRQGGYGGGAGPAIVAKVNGTAITRQDFLAELARSRGYSEQNLEMQAYLQTAALDGLVEQIINLQAAEAEGIRPSRADVDAERERHIDTILSIRYPSKRQLKRAVIAAGGKDKLRRSIQNEAGFPTDEAIRRQLMLQQLDEKVRNAVQVTDEEVKQSFEEVRARHILVGLARVQPPKGKKAADLTDEERHAIAKAKAERILQQVRGGADFAALAKKESDDTATQAKGGDLGWFKRGQMVKEFDEVAFSLPKGQVSGVVKTRFGYHIIKVEDKRTNLPKDFEKNKQQYKDNLLRERQYKASEDYHKKLLAAAQVEILDPVLKAFKLLEPNSETGAAPTAAQEQEAVALLEKAAAEYAADDPLVNFTLGQLYEKAKRTDDAIAAYKKAADYSTSPAVALALGRLYRQKGDKEQALSQFALASDFAASTESDTGPAYGNYYVHIQLRSIYEEMKRPDLVKVEDEWIKQFQEETQRPSQPIPITP